MGSRHGAPTLPDAVTVLAATRLTADADPRRAPEPGSVRSVHRAAIYVDLAAAREQVILAIDDVGGLPGGVLVRATDLRSLGVRPGMRVRSAGSRWQIPDAGFAIETASASVWDPSLAADGRLVWDGDAAHRADVARRTTTAHAQPGGLWPIGDGQLDDDDSRRDPWQHAAGRSIAALSLALGADDPTVAISPAIELIGLGVGLTPSGDDLLVGLLAGLEATGHPSRAALAAAIGLAAPARTTAVGAAALRQAARGCYTERLIDVVAAIAGRGRGDRPIAAAVERALAYGATSGSDTLAGLFVALDVAAHRARSAVGDRQAAA